MDLLRYLYGFFFFFFFLAIFNSLAVVLTNTGGKIDISAFTIPYTPRLHQDESLELAKSCLIYILTCKAK